MKVTLVGADSPLGETLIPLLADQPLQLVETGRQDLRVPEVAAEVVRDSQKLIYLAATAIPDGVGEFDDGAETVDYLPRCTYQLLTAAAEAGVSRIVVCSTVDVMVGHDPRWRVNERYRPRPPAEARPLAALLMETVCTEVSLVRNLPTMCLRLGHLCLEEEVVNAPYDPLWLDLRDAARVVRWALDLDWPKRFFEVLHVVHPSDRPRVDSAFHRHGASAPEFAHRFGQERHGLGVAA